MNATRLLAAAALLAVAGTAAAASSCTLSVVGVAFGLYNTFDPVPRDASGSITMSCTNSGRIGIGQGNSGNAARREMRSGPNRLLYNVYKDAARTQPWGRVGTDQDLEFRPGTNVRLPIHGRIPALQDVAPGSYSDTLVVNINF